MDQKKTPSVAQLKQKDGKLIDVAINALPIKIQEGIDFDAPIISSCFDGQKNPELKFQTIFELAPDAMIIINQDGIITLINLQVETLFGYSRDELLRKPVEILIPERYRNRHAMHRKRYFNEPRVRPMGENLELYGLHKNGHEFAVEISISPLEIEEGSGAIASVRDYSRVKKNTQQLEAINQDLDAFTYSVAHDLKAPLRAINGFSKILLDDYSDKLDLECQRITSIICTNAKKMGQLIDDLLAFSHIGRHEMIKKPLNMTQMVNDVYTEFKTDISHRDIEFELKDLPDINADGALIHQVWENLISNAIKFTQTIPHARIEVGSLTDDTHWVTYYIKDNGIGFDMKYADKLFGVFQRLHGPEIEGTGIGLANVKRIITRHGGTVRGEGQLGSGATIYFTLPKE